MIQRENGNCAPLQRQAMTNIHAGGSNLLGSEFLQKSAISLKAKLPTFM
jgi:hypothetical protein